MVFAMDTFPFLLFLLLFLLLLVFLMKYYSEHQHTKEMKCSCPDWRGRGVLDPPPSHSVGSVSTWPAPDSSEQTEGQQEAQPGAGETEAQGGGGTCPEPHSPEGCRQVLLGQPHPKTISVSPGPGCRIRRQHLPSVFPAFLCLVCLLGQRI